MIGKWLFAMLFLLYSSLLIQAHDGAIDLYVLPKDEIRIRVIGPLQNAVRNAYKTSSRFRTIYDRLKKEPRLDLVISAHTRQRGQYRSDLTVVRIAYDSNGGIRRIVARVQINAGSGATRTQRIGHELAHLEEILDKQMAPSKIAKKFPDLAFSVEGWLSHYETYYALDAEMEISAQNKDDGDDLSIDQLETMELTLFGSRKSSQREQRRRTKYYKKLRKK